MVGMPSNYASNAVACKLWGILESPVELILGVAIFNALRQMYGWPCWVFTDWEFRTFADREQNTGQETFAIVPQFGVSGVGHVDFAIFASQISVEKPLVVIEADGHSYHERTPAQASEDKRRDRALQKIDFSVLRYTGTDVVRNSNAAAQEVAEFVHAKVHEEVARLCTEAERDAIDTELMYRRYGVL